MARLNLIRILLPLLALVCASCDFSSSKAPPIAPRVQWTYHLSTARDLTADYIGDGIIICSSAGALDWVDVSSGVVRHSVTDPQMYSNGLMWFASPDGQVYYMLRGGYYDSYGGTLPPSEKLSCRNSAGELEWEIRMPAGDSLVSTAIGEDRIFIILSDGSVMAVSRNGETLWYRQMDAVRLTGFAALISSQLVFIDKQGYLCVADYDGNMIWQSEEKMGFYSATFELPDGSLALYDFPLALRYFDSQGRLQWREEFDDYAPGRSNLQGASNVSEYNVDRMIVGMPGNGCAVAHPDGRISAFDASGKLQWRSVPTGASQLICSDSSGNVYASVRGGSLYAFSSSGKLVWEHDKLAGLNSAPSVDPMGNLYIETISDLYCLDPNMPASQ